MLRWMLVLSAWTVSTLLVRPAPLSAQALDPSPAALKRMRAALARPPSRLQVGVPPIEAPTFRVEVAVPFSAARPIEDEPFDPTWGLPSAGELIAGGIGKIGSAVRGYRRHRAERRARQEVEDAMAEYCAVNACPPPATPARASSTPPR
jgi:hypothetical protein